MTFRDDRDALLARNEALEREVADAKRALADKERELERERNPLGAAIVETVEPVSIRATAQAPASKARGRALAADLISGDPSKVEASLAELADAPPIVTDAAAGALSGFLHEGGARARAVCEVYVAHTPPRLGGGSHHKLLRAFVKASTLDGLRDVAERAMAAHVTLGVDAKYLDKRAQAATGGASAVRRVLWTFKRAWVIVVFWLPALFAMVLLATQPGMRAPLGAAVAGLAMLVVLIDAYLRRCASCRRWLAGREVLVVRDQYDSHVTSWSCTFCAHRWTSSRYAGPR